jgi:hypothetical protein
VCAAAVTVILPDVMKTATTHPSLLVRLLDSQPTTNLVSLRREIAADLARAQEEARKLMSDLREVDRVLADRDGADVPNLFSQPDAHEPKPGLKRAILFVLDEDPQAIWHRDDLERELDRRGWGAGGLNPRNVFTSRLRDLEKDEALIRLDRDHFVSLQHRAPSAENEGAPAM